MPSLKKTKINKILYWIPRLLAILYVLFISMFALDIFGNGYTFWQTVVGLFMHLIPSFLLLIVLWISWKRERIGTIIFILFGLIYAYQAIQHPIWILIISGPAVLTGILFWINWIMRKRNKLKK